MAKQSRRYHHGDLRVALVAKALDALDAAPDTELTLRGLAKKVGVSPMAPYAHFEDKEALLDAVAAEGFAALSAELDAAQANAPEDPADRLEALAETYVGFGMARPGLYRLMFAGPAAAEGSLARMAGAQAIARLEASVAAVSPPGAATRPTTDIAWAFVHGLTLLVQSGYLHPGAELAARMRTVSQMVAGLAGQGGAPQD